jgi:hypothetical protein
MSKYNATMGAAEIQNNNSSHHLCPAALNS